MVPKHTSHTPVSLDRSGPAAWDPTLDPSSCSPHASLPMELAGHPSGERGKKMLVEHTHDLYNVINQQDLNLYMDE